jgi:DNA-binding transcriptional LysR family regulator
MFLAIVDLGSAGKAAERLGISQPALTQTISRLEERLRVKLFERSPRGMQLTRHGHTIAERARIIVNESRYLIEELEAFRDGEGGELIVGAGPSLASWLVPEVVCHLNTIRPHLNIKVVEGMTDRLFPALQRAEIDVAVSTLSGPNWEKEFASEVVMHDVMTVFGRAGHELAGQQDVTLLNTLRFPWIMPPAGEALRFVVEDLFNAANLVLPRRVVETNSISCMRALLQKGDYLTFVPRTLFVEEQRTNVLVPLAVEAGERRRLVHAVYRQSEALSASAKLFINALHRTARARK